MSMVGASSGAVPGTRPRHNPGMTGHSRQELTVGGRLAAVMITLLDNGGLP